MSRRAWGWVAWAAIWPCFAALCLGITEVLMGLLIVVLLFTFTWLEVS